MRRLATGFIAGATMLALTACGTTEAPADADGAPSGDVVTVTDARGAEVEIPAGATSVVALEWVAVEHLQTVGIAPVGVADVEGYAAWSGVGEPLEGEPTDVGTRTEPSIDAIAALAPDLIIDVVGRDDSLIEDLEAIAPVLVLQGADATKGVDTMLDDLTLVGEATGTEDAAADAIVEYETQIEAIGERIMAAGIEGTPIAHMDGYENGGQIEIRPYGEGALLVSVFESIGLANAWSGEVDPQYGLGVTDVEGLTVLPADAHIVYMTSEEPDVFQEQLATNAIWNSLPAVAADDVHRLPDGIWLFGGVHSMTTYADALATALGA